MLIVQRRIHIRCYGKQGYRIVAIRTVASRYESPWPMLKNSCKFAVAIQKIDVLLHHEIGTIIYIT
jgi:hypothetical protein